MVALLGRCPELPSASLVLLPSQRQLAALIPYVSLLNRVVEGMEAMYQVGNKSLQKPQNPCKNLHLFHVLSSWISLHLFSNSLSGTMHILSAHTMLKNFMAVPGPWIFYRVTTIFSLAGVPAKSAERQVFTCQHSIINVTGQFYWCGRREQEQVLGYQPMTCCGGYVGSFGEALERSIFVPSTWRQIGLGTQWVGGYWKKVLESPVQHGTFLGLWSKYRR